MCLSCDETAATRKCMYASLCLSHIYGIERTFTITYSPFYIKLSWQLVALSFLRKMSFNVVRYVHNYVQSILLHFITLNVTRDKTVGTNGYVDRTILVWECLSYSL